MAYAKLSQSPSLLVSASGSRPHRSLCHRKYKKIPSPRFALEKNFELDLWVSLGLRRQMDKFPGDLNLENKTYKLKRSIEEV